MLITSCSRGIEGDWLSEEEFFLSCRRPKSVLDSPGLRETPCSAFGDRQIAMKFGARGMDRAKVAASSDRSSFGPTPSSVLIESKTGSIVIAIAGAASSSDRKIRQTKTAAHWPPLRHPRGEQMSLGGLLLSAAYRDGTGKASAEERERDWLGDVRASDPRNAVRSS